MLPFESNYLDRGKGRFFGWIPGSAMPRSGNRNATTVKFCLLQRKDHTTDSTHALHSLSYHSVTTLADDEIESLQTCL